MWLFLHSISGPFLEFFLSLRFVSVIILKQKREGKEKKWNSEAHKVTLVK